MKLVTSSVISVDKYLDLIVLSVNSNLSNIIFERCLGKYFSLCFSQYRIFVSDKSTPSIFNLLTNSSSCIRLYCRYIIYKQYEINNLIIDSIKSSVLSTNKPNKPIP